MKKTLKTLINTGLFMLFFSHSHGLALVYNLNDVINQTGAGDTILLDNTTHPGFNGIDDTFDGSITFNFTLTFDQYFSTAEQALFMLSNNGSSFTGIGGYYSGNWSGMPADLGPFGNIDLGSNPIVAGVSQAFTMTIDYNAGALDTGTVVLAGDSTVYNLVDYDYSFDQIIFQTFPGSGDGTIQIASATDMSVSIVPEPATYALISGALALVFVAVRRRFKAESIS